MPAAIASWKQRSIDATHLAGRPNSFSKSKLPALAASLMACSGELKCSMRWLPSLDLMTISTFLSICFCWISLLTGSIKLRPCKISSSTPSRKTLSQLPGPPAAIPLMTTSLCVLQAAGCAVQAAAGWTGAAAAGAAAPAHWAKAGLKVEWSPNTSVPFQSM